MPVLRLRQIREGKGVSLRALKKRSGVAVSSLARYEAGQGDPQLTTLRKIAKALGVTVAELIGDRGPFPRRCQRVADQGHDYRSGALRRVDA